MYQERENGLHNVRIVSDKLAHLGTLLEKRDFESLWKQILLSQFVGEGARKDDDGVIQGCR